MDIFDTLKVGKVSKLIKNTDLDNFVSYKIGKTAQRKEDLNGITEITLNGLSISGAPNFVYFDELGLFSNLQSVDIKDMSISHESMQWLSNLASVRFEGCDIESLDGLKAIKRLGLVSSKLEEMNSLFQYADLEGLELDSVDLSDYSFLEKFSKLKNLSMKNMSGFMISQINPSAPIESLTLENIEDLDVESLMRLKKLRRISVGINDAEKFEKQIKKLKGNNIQVEYNNVYRIQGDEDDYCI